MNLSSTTNIHLSSGLPPVRVKVVGERHAFIIIGDDEGPTVVVHGRTPRDVANWLREVAAYMEITAIPAIDDEDFHGVPA